MPDRLSGEDEDNDSARKVIVLENVDGTTILHVVWLQKINWFPR